jgi:hypothetical protein
MFFIMCSLLFRSCRRRVDYSDVGHDGHRVHVVLGSLFICRNVVRRDTAMTFSVLSLLPSTITFDD